MEQQRVFDETLQPPPPGFEFGLPLTVSSGKPVFATAVAGPLNANYSTVKTVSIPVLKGQFLVLLAAALDDRVAVVLSVEDSRRHKWTRTLTSPSFLGGDFLEFWTVFAKHDDTITITVTWTVPVIGGLIVASFNNVTAVGNTATVLCTGCTGESVTINALSADSLLVGACYLDNCGASPSPACGPAVIQPGSGQIQRASVNSCLSGSASPLAYDLEEKPALAGTNSFSYTTIILPSSSTCGFAGGGRTLILIELR